MGDLQHRAAVRWQSAMVTLAGQTHRVAWRAGLPAASSTTPAAQLLAEMCAQHPAQRLLLLDVTAALPALVCAPATQVHVHMRHAGMAQAARRTLDTAQRTAQWWRLDAPWPVASVDVVYIEANLSHEAWLRQLAHAYTALVPGGQLWAAAPNTAGGKRLVHDAQLLFGAARGSSKAHQRVVHAIKPAHDINPLPWTDIAGVWPQTSQTLDVSGRTYTSVPGVFAHGRLDVGSALLCDQLPDLSGSRVLDLGGGIGVLAGTALQRGAAHVDVIDVDASAVWCMQQTFARDDVRVAWGDVLDGLPWSEALYDVVISNPPFHTGKRTDDSMVRAFVSTAAGHQRPGGTLWLVANAFLAYGPLLESYYAQVSRVAETPAFVVWRAVKG